MPKQVTFSIEALEALVKKVAIERGLAIVGNGKVRKVVDLKDGKTARQIENEKATIRAFKKAGFGVVIPHNDVKTFNRWMAVGMRPVEGSKSVKARGMSLFHKTQVRPLNSAERAGLGEQRQLALKEKPVEQAQ